MRKIAASWSNGEYGLLLSLGMLLVLVWISSPLASQTREQTTRERKVITRVEPNYPETLKRLYIGGVVRVEVVVAPDGGVASAKLLGGSPILGQSAMKAIKKWRYGRASGEEKLIVTLEFDPHR